MDAFLPLIQCLRRFSSCYVEAMVNVTASCWLHAQVGLIAAADREFFEQSAKAHNMSGRAIMRTLSVARTIADMEESHEVLMTHLCEALSFRVREGVGV